MCLSHGWNNFSDCSDEVQHVWTEWKLITTTPVRRNQWCWMEQHMWLTTVSLMSGELSSSPWLEFCGHAMAQADLHTQTNTHQNWRWGWHWWQHRSRWSSMAMTDSHPTWGQSPPLELDCTPRPDRRGELLCLPSPDRPIKAARNWEALGPITG